MPIVNDREYYVGAPVLDDLQELQALTARTSGFLILDYYAIDGRIPNETLEYIRNEMRKVYHNKTNDVSEVWVYQYGE